MPIHQDHPAIPMLLKLYFPCLGLLLLASGAAGCRESGVNPATPNRELPPPAERGLEAVPRAEPSQFQAIPIEKWSNPSVEVTPEAIEVLWGSTRKSVNSVEELTGVLRSIPLRDWPLGRVVAYSEQSVLSAGDEEIMDRRRRIVRDAVDQLEVTLEVWPSS